MVIGGDHNLFDRFSNDLDLDDCFHETQQYASGESIDTWTILRDYVRDVSVSCDNVRIDFETNEDHLLHYTDIAGA